MPIYEYRCRDCGATTNVLFRSIAAAEAGAACERCGSQATERLISRTFIVKGAARFDEYDADRRIGEVGDIPQSGDFARWARKLSRELGDSGGGDKFREMAEKAEAGADPIERVDPGHTLRYQIAQQRDAAASGGSSSDSGGAGDGGGE